MLIAARKGHAEVCELLIKHGMDKDLTNKYGYTALHLAAKNDRFNVCKVLVENSVKMDLRTTRLSYMPIHFAAKNVSSPQFLMVKYSMYSRSSFVGTGHFFHTSLTQCLVFLGILLRY